MKYIAIVLSCFMCLSTLWSREATYEWKITSDTRDAQQLSSNENIIWMSSKETDDKNGKTFYWTITSQVLAQYWVVVIDKKETFCDKIYDSPEMEIEIYSPKELSNFNRKIINQFKGFVDNIENEKFIEKITSSSIKLKDNLILNEDKVTINTTIFQAKAKIQFALVKNFADNKKVSVSEIILDDISTDTFAKRRQNRVPVSKN